MQLVDNTQVRRQGLDGVHAPSESRNEQIGEKERNINNDAALFFCYI